MAQKVRKKTQNALDAQIARWESAILVKKKAIGARRTALKRKKFDSLTDALRAHLKEYVTRGEVTLSELERQTGLSRQTVNKFIKGSSMRLDKADTLARYFGFVVGSGKLKASDSRKAARPKRVVRKKKKIAIRPK